jgi:hypothetical protein
LTPKTRRKSLKKIPYKFKNCWGEKKIPPPFFDRCFHRRQENFFKILNHILLGFYIPMPGVKNQRGFWGDFFELFGLTNVKSVISQIAVL